MAASGIPLSREQSTALAEIYAVDLEGANVTFDKNGRPDLTTGLSAYDDTLLNHAGAILSPDQLEILRDNLKDAERRKMAAETAK